MASKQKKEIPLHCQRSTLKTASRKDELLPLRSPSPDALSKRLLEASKGRYWCLLRATSSAPSEALV